MKKIGIGIIGWGFMGMTHAHALRAIPLFYPELKFHPELVYICSRRIEKAERAAFDLGFSHFTDDYRKLLKCKYCCKDFVCSWHRKVIRNVC